MEILAPAGNIETARAALFAGADAVYLGLKNFSARANSENFESDSLFETVRLAHVLGAKVYVCLNTLVKDGEIDGFVSSAVEAWNAGADALLIQDIFLGKKLKERYPQMVLHLSTQAGCCNEWGAKIAKEFGFSRVVLARETAFQDIEKIAKIIETEVFVQGALCACFSGQCYLSSFIGNNSGNRGRCKQPCRKQYSIDRAGFEELSYALSPSDLSLGNRLNELIAAGVCSLKIEGRMRRLEYVAAAVKYYRARLNGERAEGEFSDLKRAFNRGNYTEGIAFGERNFLSRNVQGHIGENVGTVSFRGGKPFCASGYKASEGDGFKILREGKEVGGARVTARAEDGFFLSSERRLKTGDEVCVTTSLETNARALAGKKTRKIALSVKLVAGEKPEITCGDYRFTGEELVEQAKSAPLRNEEITACFLKTDGLPFAPEITVETENAFLPKSALNRIRRDFYEGLCNYLCPPRTPLVAEKIGAELTPEVGTLTAAISRDGNTGADVEIIKNMQNKGGMYEDKAPKKRFLYLPAYLTGDDEREVEKVIGNFDGLYCDGYYGLALAEKYKKPLFAGTGFNLCNAVAVAEVIKSGAAYFTLSKELTDGEQRTLSARGAFALSAGSIKVMDFIFCPFSRSCGSCDMREFYTLTDGDGRKFPLRRYGKKGACRFELYNCAPLAAYNGVSSALVDLTAENGTELVGNARTPERVLKNATGGHKNRSML